MLFAGQIGKLHKLNCCYRARRQTLSPMIVAGRFKYNTAFAGGVNLARIVRLEKASVLPSAIVIIPPLCSSAFTESPDTYVMILRTRKVTFKHDLSSVETFRREKGTEIVREKGSKHFLHPDFADNETRRFRGRTKNCSLRDGRHPPV